MAELKKNAVNQILFTMVDKTDFNTLETSLASNFTVKRFGVNRGSAAANVSTLSRLVSKVGSGVYRLSLEANACNYDFMFLRIAHASAATQMLAFEMKTLADDDASNYFSNMSNYLSNFSNYLSAASAVRSDIYSMLVANSDILSKVQVLATVAASGASLIPGMSDILSKVYVLDTSMASDIISMISTVSQLRVRAGYSTVSDLTSKITSAVWASAKGVSTLAYGAVAASAASDANSRLNDASFLSDLASRVRDQVWNTGYSNHVTASTFGSILETLKGGRASLTSDMASAVWAHAVGNSVAGRVSKIVSIASDAHSAAAQGNSRTLVIQSLVSDVDSALTSRFSDIHSFMSTTGVGLNASTMSDLRSAMNAASVFLQASNFSDIMSAIAAGPAATITASDISNIASAVWGQKYNIHSTASTFGSLFEKIASSVSDTQSALDSQFAVMLSDVSNVYSLVSDVQSAVAGAATASDVASKVWATGYSNAWGNSTFGSFFFRMNLSGMNLSASNMSDIRSAVAAGPAATITASDMSDIASRVWAAKYTGNSVASSFGSLLSDIYSKVLLCQSMASDAHSAAAQANSRVLLTQSLASDAHSAAAQANSRVLLVQSLASDIDSAISSQALLNASWFSDIDSALSSQYTKVYSGVTRDGSQISLVKSLASDAYSTARLAASYASDVYSFLTSASFMSDIGSAVWGTKYTAHSLASTFGSGFEKMLSGISDISNAVSDIASILNSQSLISNIASAVWGQKYTAHSAASTFGSLMSDIYSVALLTQSRASDAHSAAAQANSRVLLTQSMASDAHSAAAQANSRALVIQSFASDIDSALTSRFSDIHSFMSTTGVGLNASTMSDLRSAVAAGPAATVTASDISDIASAVWANAIGSDVNSKVIKLASRITKAVANSSQVSDMWSDIRSQVSTAGAGVTVSNISDIASAVWAYGAAASLVSRVSDVQSALDSQYTKVYSAVQAGGLNASAISDIASAVWGQKFKGAAAHNVASTFGSAFALMTSRVSDIDSAADSQYTKVYSAINRDGSQLSLVKSVVSDTYSMAKLGTSYASDTYSMLSNALSAGFGLNASALSDIGSVVDDRLNVAYTDATSLNANSLKERIRSMGWVLRNKIIYTKASGNVQLLKDDNTTEAYSVAGHVTSDATSTVRKRIE